MARRRILFLLVLLMLVFSVVPVAHAQDAPPVDFQEIISRLGPRSGSDLLFDILLYLIFFMALITSVFVPDKQLIVTLIVTAVMGMTIIAKLSYVGIDYRISPQNLIILGINAGIFTLPLVVAGMVRSRQGTPKAMAPAVITGLLGGAYFFLYWALVLRA